MNQDNQKERDQQKPKVFLSYSWSSPKHETWIIQFAERLRDDGVDVVFDKWDLKEGYDLYHFMETMVRSEEIDKVLVILDKRYQEKADARVGGVGTETQIISPKIYKDVAQEKFIPIITEKDENDNPYIPTFIDGKVYIDLSDDSIFEDGYEKLLRNLFNRPTTRKPKLGKPPSYLFTESPSRYKTATLINIFNKSVPSNPGRAISIARDFYDEINSVFEEFRIDFQTGDEVENGKLIYENIKEFQPILNNFIRFTDNLLKENPKELNSDLFMKFFEKIYAFTEMPKNHSGGSYEYYFDNYKFFRYELFLYLIAILTKNERYDLISEILYSEFFIISNRRTQVTSLRYDHIYFELQSILHYYIKALSINVINPGFHYFMKNIPEEFPKESIYEADLICCYAGFLNRAFWIPYSYHYENESGFRFFHRLKSEKHFQNVKCLFNVETPEGLKEKIIESERSKEHFSFFSCGSIRPLPDLSKLIPINELCTLR